jgi:N-acetyl-anhydromuramyl-L-alanine amidase AmpD
MQYLQTTNVSSYTTSKIGFIIHGTLGKYKGAITWLCTPPSKRPDGSASSAHYVISKGGDVTQLARNEQVTWHAGRMSSPTWRARKYLPLTNRGVPMVGPFKNPNDSFIGIEFEWFKGDDITEAQYVEATKIIKNSGIKDPIILSHAEVTKDKPDFKDALGVINMLPVQELLRRVK